MSEVQLYDSNTVDQLKWPETKRAQLMRSFFLPLMKEGVKGYIANVETKLYLLVLDDLLLPVTVNQEEYHNSYVVSNYYALQALEEEVARAPFLKKSIQKPFIKLAGGMLKFLKVNKTVLVNNWLLTNNLLPEVSSEQMNEMVSFLSARFPDHLLMIRNVNRVKNSSVYETLQVEKFRLFFSRQVYIYDPARKEKLSSKVHYHHRRDSRLLEKEGYEMISEKDLSPDDFSRLLELYDKVYIEGHTSFSPHYTKKYLENALSSGLLRFKGVRRGGQIDGIFGYYMVGGVMTVPFFGYDNDLPNSGALYRMLSVFIIKEAEDHGCILNDGSGGEKSKKYRGLVPHPEFVAIFDNHLPLTRRLFWMCAEKIMRRFSPRR